MEIVIASQNLGKIKEIKSILTQSNLSFLSLLDFPKCPPLVEDGKTYYENALKKAKTVCDYTKKITLADDSGLEIPALNNEPGLFSARYAGDNATYKQNIQKVIEKFKNLPPNTSKLAFFKCVIALVYPDGKMDSAEGTCEGEITLTPHGSQGFGYDPIFYLQKFEKTFAELSPQEKNLISHRSQALNKIKERLLANP